MFMYSARPTMSISQCPRSYEYSIIILIDIGKKCMIYIKIHTEGELRGGGGVGRHIYNCTLYMCILYTRLTLLDIFLYII